MCSGFRTAWVVLGAILLVLVADVLYLCPKNEINIKYLCDCDV